jgi:hypothetical protein
MGKQTTGTGAAIVRAALEASTTDDAERVQKMIAADIGARYERPAGDRWNNHGMLSSVGNREHKLLEVVTNAQDAVLERLALKRFGSRDQVPFSTPHEAAVSLLGDRPWKDVADMVTIEMRESDPPVRTSKRLTAVVGDVGCGIANDYLSQSLLFLGTSHKDKAPWQQGAFGLGGAQTFRHAKAVVIVTRPHPDTKPHDDSITVAVCQWREHEKGKGLYYLVTSDWADGNNLDARPWSAPASAFPEFEGGTHVALISYEISGYAVVRHGADKSLERVIGTRLFEPVTPVSLINQIDKKEPVRGLRGLARQLEENPRRDRKLIRDTMPYRVNGETAHLPIKCYYFAAERDTPGDKRSVVAAEHAVMFTSNGQVHKHWSPQELRNRTELRHLYDRVLIVVELDELPIKLRTNLFPPDRSGLMDNEHAQKLERNLIEWLNDPDGELFELDRELLRKALTSDRNGRPTINIARQIGRALKFKGGFGLIGGRSGGEGRRRRTQQVVDLYPDPTTLEGPAQAQIEQGATRGIRFHINANDEFLSSRRGELELVCDHPDIGDREITVGELRKGYVRVTIAMADGAELGDFTLLASLRGWQRASGGIGADLEWTTKLTVIEPREERQSKPRSSSEDPDAEGELVGVAWRGEGDFDDWHPGVPGHVEAVEAKLLAEEADDYKELEKLGDAKVPTIFLNRDYSPLKRYEAARAKDLTGEGIERARDRYAVGAGLGLLLLDRDLKAKCNGAGLSDAAELTAKQAAAQSALVMMPQYDKLAHATGVNE